MTKMVILVYFLAIFFSVCLADDVPSQTVTYETCFSATGYVLSSDNCTKTETSIKFVTCDTCVEKANEDVQKLTEGGKVISQYVNCDVIRTFLERSMTVIKCNPCSNEIVTEKSVVLAPAKPECQLIPLNDHTSIIGNCSAGFPTHDSGLKRIKCEPCLQEKNCMEMVFTEPAGSMKMYVDSKKCALCGAASISASLVLIIGAIVFAL